MQRNQATLDFVSSHRTEDVRQLAFLGNRFPEVDMPWALDQIGGWQRARRKLPSWAAREGIVYPPHLAMEQCSSEATARYKQQLAARLMGDEGNGTLVDITGGFGVDFSFMARAFAKAVYVERQAHLCDIAESNFRLLGVRQAEVVNADGADYLDGTGRVNVIFADPARRDRQGCRTFAIADCTPDVAALRPRLLEKANFVVVKLSPMLDWHKAVDDMGGWTTGGGSVAEVHIVSVANECKELLLVLCRDAEGRRPVVCCVNDGEAFAYGPGDEREPVLPVGAGDVKPGNFLYEPNASMMKAGCFDEVAVRHGVRPVGRDAHLFVSPSLNERFPGRKFRIEALSSMNKTEVKRALSGIGQANVAVRHFPMTAEALRKRLKLKDGGDIYLFATTLGARDHTLIICKKVP